MNRTRRMLGLLAASALAVAIVPLAAFGEGSGIGVEFVDETPVGFLEVETGDSFILIELFNDTDPELRDPEADKLASLKVDVGTKPPNKCFVADAESPPFELKDGDTTLGSLSISAATIDPSTDLEVGLVKNGLGSYESTCSEGSGLLEDGQALTLELGGGLLATHASLDVEGKYGASLDWRASLAGQEVASATEVPLSDGPDNGSDSGVADNLAVAVSAAGEVFDAVTISPFSLDGRGAIALEGGGDYVDPAANRTVFTVVNQRVFDNTLKCDLTTETVPFTPLDPETGQPTGIPAEGDTAVSATIESYGLATKVCADIGYDLTTDGGAITFDNSPDAPVGLRLTLVWRIPLTDVDGARLMEGDVYAEVDREVDFNEEGLPVGLARYCLANNDTDTVMAPALQPPVSGKTGGETASWCLLDETVEVGTGVDAGYLIQTQVYDGIDDPRFF